jgi:hypothetical protein
MARDILDNRNSRHSGRNPRSGRNRRSAPCERSEEEKFLNGAGRFKRHSECQNSISSADDGDAAAAPKSRGTSTERRAAGDRRSGRDRRCGFDTRSEVELFLQGERRSSIDRRSGIDRRYRSFKKARAFARGLGLKSEREWYDYINSGLAPGDIPAAPHHVYANDGWAGWVDWLGASGVATYLFQYRPFEVARTLARGLHLKKTDSKPTDSGE